MPFSSHCDPYPYSMSVGASEQVLSLLITPTPHHNNPVPMLGGNEKRFFGSSWSPTSIVKAGVATDACRLMAGLTTGASVGRMGAGKRGAGEFEGMRGAGEFEGMRGAGELVGISGAGEFEGMRGAGLLEGIKGAGELVGIRGAGLFEGIRGAGELVGIRGAGELVGIRGAGE